MKKNCKLRITVVIFILVVLSVQYVYSLNHVKKHTISFIPTNVTAYLYSYLDVLEKSPEKAINYVHFESDLEREAFALSYVKILDYEILGAQKINEKLYAFEIRLEKECYTPPKRFYFVGLIDENPTLMVNIRNIPESLKEGLDDHSFSIDNRELDGIISVSPQSIIN